MVPPARPLGRCLPLGEFLELRIITAPGTLSVACIIQRDTFPRSPRRGEICSLNFGEPEWFIAMDKRSRGRGLERRYFSCAGVIYDESHMSGNAEAITNRRFPHVDRRCYSVIHRAARDFEIPILSQWSERGAYQPLIFSRR